MGDQEWSKLWEMTERDLLEVWGLTKEELEGSFENDDRSEWLCYWAAIYLPLYVTGVRPCFTYKN